jgi:SAM-dependent MidA family methyltransferase
VSAAAAWSGEPAEELRRRIARHGPIGFDEFMAVALYHPEGGYYASQNNRVGRRGDFLTSVSMGPVFGKLLAAQFLEMRELLGSPADFTLVEQGANDGQLMHDILSVWPGKPPRVIIVEPLAARRAVQQAKLAPWAESLTHVASEEDLPPFAGGFFANELLDAFPVRLLVREHGAWFEQRVDVGPEGFVFRKVPLEDPQAKAAANSFPIDGHQGFRTEWCPSLARWMQTVAAKLQRGWLLLVDYGHPAAARYHPARASGTLASYHGHQRTENPLADPGQQDLTAHVDFTAAADAAMGAGMQIAGFTDQHHALTALAEKVFPAMPDQPLPAEAAREMRALRQLLHPESMGTSFKFLALAKNSAAPLTAFRFARDAQQELFA